MIFALITMQYMMSITLPIILQFHYLIFFTLLKLIM